MDILMDMTRDKLSSYPVSFRRRYLDPALHWTPRYMSSYKRSPMTPLTPWIYFAGPLFTAAEIDFNAAIATGLRAAGYSVYLPQEECAGITDPHELFQICVRGIDGAALMVVMLDGTDADSGSCFELGYAYAKGMPVVGVRTDFRGSGEHLGLNLMLTHSCDRLLLTSLHPQPANPRIRYRGPNDPILPLLLDLLRGYSELA